MIRDVDFTVRKGEIVGIAGLMGTGRTELAMSMFGRSYGRKHHRARCGCGGKAVDTSTVAKAIDAGIAYVTEDRKALGLVLEEPILKNISLANLAGHRRRAASSTSGARAQVAEGYRKRLTIRTPGGAAEGGEPVGRQPAEGRAVEVAVHRAAGADPGRADARHRRGREVRDLRDHERPRRRRAGAW